MISLCLTPIQHSGFHLWKSNGTISVFQTSMIYSYLSWLKYNTALVGTSRYPCIFFKHFKFHFLVKIFYLIPFLANNRMLKLKEKRVDVRTNVCFHNAKDNTGDTTQRAFSCARDGWENWVPLDRPSLIPSHCSKWYTPTACEGTQKECNWFLPVCSCCNVCPMRSRNRRPSCLPQTPTHWMPPTSASISVTSHCCGFLFSYLCSFHFLHIISPTYLKFLIYSSVNQKSQFCCQISMDMLPRPAKMNSPAP